MIRVFAILLVWSTGVAAQVLPALYDVSGVAADDVLNVRAAPDAGAEIVGSLAPDATGVEVVALGAGGGWGQVNVGERAGWASLAFLTRQPGQEAEALADTLSCGGTEPFWALERDGGVLTLSEPDAEPRTWDGAATLRASGRLDAFAAMAPSTATLPQLTATIARRACSDGMSDRAYGLALHLLLGHGPDARLLSGCCSLEAP